jgi:hypothetical protein
VSTEVQVVEEVLVAQVVVVREAEGRRDTSVLVGLVPPLTLG